MFGIEKDGIEAQYSRLVRLDICIVARVVWVGFLSGSPWVFLQRPRGARWAGVPAGPGLREVLSKLSFNLGRLQGRSLVGGTKNVLAPLQ